MPTPAPYPWQTLEHFAASSSQWLSAIQRRLDRDWLGRLNAGLRDMLGVETELVFRDLRPAAGPHVGADSVCFEDADGELLVMIACQAQLTEELLGAVLNRPPHLSRGDAVPRESVLGALSAIVAEAARRAGVALCPIAQLASGHPTFCARATLLLGGRPHPVAATVQVLRPAALVDVGLAQLGTLPLRLPLVGAVTLAERALVEQLRAGDGFLPGVDQWWLDAAGLGRAALSTPASEHGMWVEGLGEGRYKFLGQPCQLSYDAEGLMTSSNDNPTSELADIVMDAPVVVRIEVASVSMSAREWANVHPGDVLQTETRIGESVVLRVAGQEVARGELVNVDGELGVRVKRIQGGA